MVYEVFRPVTGHTIYRTRFRLLARLVARLLHDRFAGGLDYDREGEGWT